MAIDPKTAAAVLALIDEEELVDLVLGLANIESPPGGEGPVGDAIHGWLRRAGLQPEARRHVRGSIQRLRGAARQRHRTGARLQRAHGHLGRPRLPPDHARPGPPGLPRGLGRGRPPRRQPGRERQGPDGRVHDRDQGASRREGRPRGERLPEHRRRRDRPGAGRRVPGQALSEQGSRSEVSPQPLAAARATACAPRRPASARGGSRRARRSTSSPSSAGRRSTRRS